MADIPKLVAEEIARRKALDETLRLDVTMKYETASDGYRAHKLKLTRQMLDPVEMVHAGGRTYELDDELDDQPGKWHWYWSDFPEKQNNEQDDLTRELPPQLFRGVTCLELYLADIVRGTLQDVVKFDMSHWRLVFKLYSGGASVTPTMEEVLDWTDMPRVAECTDEDEYEGKPEWFVRQECDKQAQYVVQCMRGAIHLLAFNGPKTTEAEVLSADRHAERCWPSAAEATERAGAGAGASAP